MLTSTNKHFKLALKIIFLLIAMGSYAQINPPIENPKKIIFTYKTTPNFHFENNTVYADTALLKINFPRIKYTVTKSPLDEKIIVGSISKNEMNVEEVKNFEEQIWHNFNEQHFVYDVATNTTEFQGSLCKSKECLDFFEFFFNEPTSGTDFLRYKMQYKNNKKLIITTNAFNEITKNDYSNNMVTWLNNNGNIGSFSEKSFEDNLIHSNTITVDSSLNFHVNPNLNFSNCQFGITEVKNIFWTKKLVFIGYQ